MTITGELRLPRPGRLPLVILLHGSGGVTDQLRHWEEELHEIGIATLVLDSLTARKVSGLPQDQSKLGRLAQLVDAYRALERLEAHPRIDPARIALMGFSRGGQGALYAALKRFQRLHGPPSGRAFAAHVAFYPACNTRYRDDDEVVPRPIRVFHGGADDYSPAAPCRSYAERVERKGGDIRLVEYEGAHHLFDWVGVMHRVQLIQAQTTRRCALEEAEDGRILNAGTGQAFSYGDACVEYGPTVGYHEQAAAQARQAVREFLGAVLGPEGRRASN